MSDYDIYIIKGREIKKKRGMLFKDWCVINGFEYMISELDEDYLFNNYGKTLNDLTQGFDKKVRWVCVNNPNHEMFFKPVHRTNGHWNCPYCSGSRLHLSEHSVAIDLKDLVDSEWDYDLNKISPESLTSSSLTKVWWRCRDCGSEFEQSPYKRKIGQGCPYCANLKVEAGINDVFTKRPDLESEWDFDKNDISPYSTPAGSDKKVWWKCYNGHSWYTTITSRANEGHNCPYCSSNSTSFSEKAIYYYTSLFFTDVSWRDRSLGYEYDVFLKDKKILIEFNGYYWHKNKEVIDRIKFFKMP